MSSSLPQSPTSSLSIKNPIVNSDVINIISKINDDSPQHNLIRTMIREQINMIGTQCICKHAILPNVKTEDKDYYLLQLEQLYMKAQEKLSKSNTYISLSAICQPCLYVKMGLIFRETLNDFHYNEMCHNNIGIHTYNLGYFWHALSSFGINYKIYPQIKQTQNISFFPGNVILPNPNILLQILAMPSNLIDQNIKIVWVNTKEIIDEINEINVDDLTKIYTKFVESLPYPLENGYYKRPLKNEQWNDNEKGISAPPSSRFIKVIKKDDFNSVDLKIFDINNIMSIYYAQLIKSQQRLLQIRNNRLSYCEPLSTHRTHDYIAIAIALSDSLDDLKELPPLNGRCIFTMHNILIVNRQGRAIFTTTTTKNQSTECIQLKRALKPKISTQTNTSSPNVLQQLKNPVRPIDIHPPSFIHETKFSYLSHIATEKPMVKTYQSHLTSNTDNLKRYFNTFNDDLNVDVVNNINDVSILDIAMGMYPSKILDINLKPEKNSNIDISTDESNGECMIRILETTPPNTAYSSHIGFISLTNICSNEKLVLKNMATFLPNILARDTGTNFISKNSLGNITHNINFLAEMKDHNEFIESIKQPN